MKKNITFIWPQEPFLPQGLFKHYVYLGETAQYTRQFGEVQIFDLSVKPETRKNIVSYFFVLTLNCRHSQKLKLTSGL